MIENVYEGVGFISGHKIICNLCGSGEEYEGDFQTSLDEAKSCGWKVIKEKGTWEHHCPDCLE